MITETINDLVEALSYLRQSESGGFITELEGLVRPAEIVEVSREGKSIVKRVPIALHELTPKANLTGIELSKAKRLVPDERKRCIIFFEAYPAPVGRSLPDSTIFQGRISLLCWYNGKGFSAPENRLETLLMARLLRVIKTANYQRDNVLQVEIETAQVSENSATIYSNYSFSDQNSAYFSYPFGCFKLDFTLKLMLNESCTSDLVPIDISHCA